MRQLGFGIIFLLSIGLLSGCDQMNGEHFKKHPEEALSNALRCSQLKNKEVRNDKICQAIADYEKPLCEAEVKLKGMVFAPSGGLVDCNDRYYLIARPIIEARMKAALDGSPDPVVQYIKEHGQPKG